MEVKVLLDYNTIINRCKDNKHIKFFDYLETYPKLGVVDNNIFENTRRIIRSNIRGKAYRKAIEEYKRLPLYLEIREFKLNKSTSKDYERIRRVMLDLLVEGQKSLQINMGAVARRYRNLAGQITREQLPLSEKQNLDEKIFWEVPENEDMALIAKVMSLSSKQKFIASVDKHFIDKTVSKEIEKQFEVKCRHPDNIIPELDQIIRELK